jgi:hypothetical protein
MDSIPGSATGAAEVEWEVREEWEVAEVWEEVEVWVVEEEVVAVEVVEEEVVVEVEMEGMAEEEVAPARTPPVRPSRSPKRILVRHGVIAQSIVTMLLPGPGYLF